MPAANSKFPAAWQPSCTLAVARERAAMYARIRAFFAARDVLEVDTPLLQGGANADHGIQPLAVADRFLVTSPEHPLKRCLAAGWGDVYALSACFREGEQGRRHNPEFRMLEWYRLSWDDRRLAVETIELCRELTSLAGPVQWLRYDEAFQQYAGISSEATLPQLQQALGEAGTAVRTRHEALDLLLVDQIESQLGRAGWTVLTDYPSDQAAQARLRGNTAARFELYRDGIELANGYHECTDAADLRRRLQAETEHLDERYLAACAHLPDCAGVALGLDRLLLLGLGLDDLSQVLPFAWDRA
jgi:elongation factor P--(R)-beta-lysine ligase